jgi:hypothetical protein
MWSISLYVAETWETSESGLDIPEKFLMWCWRRIKKISWTDCVRNKELLQRVKEQRNIII